jgi:KipI family sensor histidine kinase inhibitor
MKALPAGPFGMLLELGDADETQRCFGLVARLRNEGGQRFAAVVDVVPAERTVLVISTFDETGRRALRDLVALVEERGGDFTGAAGRSVPVPSGFGAVVELPVRYDGPDLAEVAVLTGLGETEIVALHASTEFTVAFTGFAPGFAYLRGLPDVLRVPRRAEPRTRVEAGSVGLAGEYSGIYPRASPGGWQVIGRLDPGAPPLWDSGREEPALLRPGMRVRFREAE